MAIYTQYGRYLKAKMLKDLLDNTNSDHEAYMLLGMGNPFWDIADENQPMPVAPFNTSILTSPSAVENQFYDNNVSVCYTTDDTENSYEVVSQGVPVEETFAHKCKDILPPSVGIWKNYSGDNKTILESISEGDNHITLTQDLLGKAYIQLTDGRYMLYMYKETMGVGGTASDQINVPNDKTKLQFFSELYLRGLALEANINKTPAGLLGLVKCKINFVKDIGQDGSAYTGDIDEFWYGDRYWKILSDNDASDEFPHHLYFTSTVNLRNLCTDLNIDQYLIPRQLSIYVRNKQGGVAGKNFYRVGENVFDFGQYTSGEINDFSEASYNILKFTLPVSVDGTGYPSSPTTFADGDFKFLLNDYIHGHERGPHSVDRFGYIVGF